MDYVAPAGIWQSVQEVLSVAQRLYRRPWLLCSIGVQEALQLQAAQLHSPQLQARVHSCMADGIFRLECPLLQTLLPCCRSLCHSLDLHEQAISHKQN